MPHIRDRKTTDKYRDGQSVLWDECCHDNQILSVEMLPFSENSSNHGCIVIVCWFCKVPRLDEDDRNDQQDRQSSTDVEQIDIEMDNEQ